jgi:hypothetical protein
VITVTGLGPDGTYRLPQPQGAILRELVKETMHRKVTGGQGRWLGAVSIVDRTAVPKKPRHHNEF